MIIENHGNEPVQITPGGTLGCRLPAGFVGAIVNRGPENIVVYWANGQEVVPPGGSFTPPEAKADS